jgi:hypothetical protein
MKAVWKHRPVWSNHCCHKNLQPAVTEGIEPS